MSKYGLFHKWWGWAWAILSVAAVIVGLTGAAVGTDAMAPYVRAGLVVVGVVLLALLIWMFRPVSVARNLSEYCDLCKESIQRVGDDGNILTVQTPIRTRDIDLTADQKEHYDEYMTATFQKLTTSSVTYRRLAVFSNWDPDTVPKTVEFLHQLIDAARACETDHRIVDLLNVHVGIVPFDLFCERIYSNLDIHITSKRNFSIAFSTKRTDRTLTFGGSVHVCDWGMHTSERLTNDLMALWDSVSAGNGHGEEPKGTVSTQDYCVHMTDFYEAYYPPANTKSDAAITEIKEKLEARVNEIVELIKSGENGTSKAGAKGTT